MWLDVENFVELVEQWWSSYEVRGRPDSAFSKKLKLLKKDIKKWNKEVFGRVEDRKKKALGRLEELDHQQCGVQGVAELKAEKESIYKELEEIAKAEETSWRQKSRCLWVKRGDKNTKFFHKMANANKRFNTVEKLQIGGRLLEGGHVIRNHILAFYEDHFSEKERWRLDWEMEEIAKLTEEEKNWLQRPFSIEEVEAAVKQLELMMGLYICLQKMLEDSQGGCDESH
nr:uncharacterized protein LOC117275774 [Nicotiana tomentosiformis]